MTPEEQNLGVRSHREFLEQGLMDVVDEIYSPDARIYNRHVPPDWRTGTEGFKSYGRMLHGAFPDMKIHHDSVVTDGSYQSIRWSFKGTHLGPIFGVPGTGKAITLDGLDIFHIENGLIVELWLEQDMIGLMQQLGLAPGPD